MAQRIELCNRVDGEGHPIDLTREEFIHFQLLLSRISGPLRTRTTSLVMSLLLAGVVLGGEVMLWLDGQAVDLLLCSAALLLAGLSLLMWCFVPVHVKKNAGKLYDRTVKGGISHYGLLRITDHCVIKQKASLTATVPIGPTTLFAEDAQMQFFLNRGGQAIVLPARCMTPELAEEARRAAQRLPQQNYRFFCRMQPQGQPVTPPAAITEVSVLFDRHVQYTPEEYVSLTKAMTVQRFWSRTPFLCTVSILAGLVFGWNGQSVWPCLIWFFLVGGVLTLLNLVLPLRRIAPAVEAMSASDLSLHMVLDDRGLRVLKDGQGEIALPWEAVTHVYDGDTMVEVTGKGQFFRIPKRFIEDFETFSQDIDTYFHK